MIREMEVSRSIYDRKIVELRMALTPEMNCSIFVWIVSEAKRCDVVWRV